MLELYLKNDEDDETSPEDKYFQPFSFKDENPHTLIRNVISRGGNDKYGDGKNIYQKIKDNLVEDIKKNEDTLCSCCICHKISVINPFYEIKVVNSDEPFHMCELCVDELNIKSYFKNNLTK